IAMATAIVIRRPYRFDLRVDQLRQRRSGFWEKLWRSWVTRMEHPHEQVASEAPEDSYNEADRSQNNTKERDAPTHEREHKTRDHSSQQPIAIEQNPQRGGEYHKAPLSLQKSKMRVRGPLSHR